MDSALAQFGVTLIVGFYFLSYFVVAALLILNLDMHNSKTEVPGAVWSLIVLFLGTLSFILGSAFQSADSRLFINERETTAEVFYSPSVFVKTSATNVKMENKCQRFLGLNLIDMVIGKDIGPYVTQHLLANPVGNLKTMTDSTSIGIRLRQYVFALVGRSGYPEIEMNEDYLFMSTAWLIYDSARIRVLSNAPLSERLREIEKQKQTLIGIAAATVWHIRLTPLLFLALIVLDLVKRQRRRRVWAKSAILTIAFCFGSMIIGCITARAANYQDRHYKDMVLDAYLSLSIDDQS